MKKEPKIASYTMVKNEADIIESFVRYNLKSVDMMFIADNLSDDGTIDILYALADEGLPVVIFSDPEVAHHQSLKTTHSYRFISNKYDFDIVFFLDADEFLEFDKATYPCHMPSLYIDRYHYLYAPAVSSSYSDDDDWTISMSYRSKALQSPKVSITTSILPRNGDVRIGEGNHHVFYQGENVSEYAEGFSAVIRHFPVRSIDQFTRKNILGWLAIMLKEKGAQDSVGKKVIGSHWRDSYKFINEKNNILTTADLVTHLYNRPIDMNTECVYDPVKFDFKFRYNSLRRPSSLSKQILTNYEKTIRELWVRKAGGEIKNSFLVDLNSCVLKTVSFKKIRNISKVWWHRPNRLVYEIHQDDINIAFDLESGDDLFSLYLCGRNQHSNTFLSTIGEVVRLEKTKDNRLKICQLELGQGAVAIEYVLDWLSVIQKKLYTL